MRTDWRGSRTAEWKAGNWVVPTVHRWVAVKVDLLAANLVVMKAVMVLLLAAHWAGLMVA